MITLSRSLAYASALTSAALLASSGFAAPAAAQAKAKAKNICFRVDNITGIAPARGLGPDRRDGVNIKVNNRDVYQLELLEPCGFQLQDSQRIGVVSRNSSYICNSNDAEIVTKAELVPQKRCTVTGLRKLDASEIASIPTGQKP